MSSATTQLPPKLPPAWFKHAFWRVHRALCRLSGGRLLWTPAGRRGWGALQLSAIGRHSGKTRHVIVGYLEDGPNLVVLAMNGWDQGHPSWWLNLEAHPYAMIRLAHQRPLPVHARLATGDERARLWQQFLAIEPADEAFARQRSVETPVVVLEPLSAAA